MKAWFQQFKNDLGYVIWALGITGWIKAARDVTRDRKARTVKADVNRDERGGVM